MLLGDFKTLETHLVNTCMSNAGFYVTVFRQNILSHIYPDRHLLIAITFR